MRIKGPVILFFLLFALHMKLLPGLPVNDLQQIFDVILCSWDLTAVTLVSGL